MTRPKYASKSSSRQKTLGKHVTKNHDHVHTKKVKKESTAAAAVRIPIRKHGLALMDDTGQIQANYSYTKQGTKERRRILAALIQRKKGGSLSVMRALVARRTLGKNRMSSKAWANISSDIEWVKKINESVPQWTLKPNRTHEEYMNQGTLEQYSPEEKSEERRQFILNDLVTMYGFSALKLWRIFHARRNFDQTLTEEIRDRLKRDMDYLKTNFRETSRWLDGYDEYE